MNLESILSTAARHNVAVHIHVHIPNEVGDSPSMPVARVGRPRGSQEQTQAVLDALAGGPLKKESIIRAIFGAGFTPSQGRAVTRMLQRLAQDNRVRQPSYSMWELS